MFVINLMVVTTRKKPVMDKLRIIMKESKHTSRINY
jgi:hypothetical protein